MPDPSCKDPYLKTVLNFYKSLTLHWFESQLKAREAICWRLDLFLFMEKRTSYLMGKRNTYIRLGNVTPLVIRESVLLIWNQGNQVLLIFLPEQLWVWKI